MHMYVTVFKYSCCVYVCMCLYVYICLSKFVWLYVSLCAYIYICLHVVYACIFVICVDAHRTVQTLSYLVDNYS